MHHKLVMLQLRVIRLLLGVLALFLKGGHCDNILVLHPFYAGSHVLTLHAVTKQLVSRGHSVTTVRYEDPNGLQLTPAGSNHSEIILHLNNSDGSIPWTTPGEKGVFHMPMHHMWDIGLNLFGIFSEGGKPWQLISGYCNSLLSDKSLL